MEIEEESENLRRVSREAFRSDEDGAEDGTSRRFCQDYQVSYFCINKKRAEDGTRTRYLQLGKLSLYQVSYFRVK